MTAFGTAVLPSDIEQAVRGVLQAWMNTYLRELERRTGRAGNALGSVKSWGLASSADQRFPEQQIPTVQITWTDMALTEHADSISADLNLSVEVMVEASSFDAVRDLAGVYTFALAWIVEHKLQADALIDAVTLPQIALPALAENDARRWRAVGTIDFTVTVNDVMTPDMGPVEPASDPTPVPPDYPTVQTADVTVIPEVV